MATVGEVSGRVLEAFNAADWDAFAACLDDGAVYVEAGTGRRVEGAAAYIDLCRGWKQAFPDVRGTVERAAEAGDWMAQEITWVGHHEGPLPMPAGTVEATGREVRVVATLWTQVRHDRVAEVHHHIDLMALLTQIGALPGAALAEA